MSTQARHRRSVHLLQLLGSFTACAAVAALYLTATSSGLLGDSPASDPDWTEETPGMQSAQSMRLRSKITVATRAQLHAVKGDLPVRLESSSMPATALELANLHEELAAQQGMCQPFRAENISCVAIVGNGPLSNQDRRDIHGCRMIIRFNLLNNFLPESERVDIWVVRYGEPAKYKYWGFSQMEKQEVDRILHSMQGIWLVGGDENARRILNEGFPSVKDHASVLMPHEPLESIYLAAFGLSSGAPSTGFVAIQAALFCSQPYVPLHIFGMNWSPSAWEGHRVDVEAQYVQQRVQDGHTVVHDTPCAKLRACTAVSPGMDAEHPDCRLLPDGSVHCPPKLRQKSAVGHFVLGSNRKEKRRRKATDRQI